VGEKLLCGCYKVFEPVVAQPQAHSKTVISAEPNLPKACPADANSGSCFDSSGKPAPPECCKDDTHNDEVAVEERHGKKVLDLEEVFPGGDDRKEEDLDEEVLQEKGVQDLEEQEQVPQTAVKARKLMEVITLIPGHGTCANVAPREGLSCGLIESSEDCEEAFKKAGFATNNKIVDLENSGLKNDRPTHCFIRQQRKGPMRLTWNPKNGRNG